MRSHRRSRALRATSGAVLALLLAGCGRDHEDAHGDDGDEHGDHAEHEGEDGHVVLDAEQLASAGVRVVPAGPGEIADVLTLAAAVQPNLDAVAHVNPRVPGIVRSIEKQLGDAVQAGDLLCEVESVDLGAAVSEYLLAEELLRAAEETLAREAELFAERLATTERVLQGAIDVNRGLLERERELQESAISTLRPVLEAERALRTSELSLEAERSELAARRDARLLELELDVRNDRIALQGARYSLRALGVTAEDLQALDESSPLLEGRYGIRASIPGVIVARHITAGEYVGPETRLYEIEDLSRVWVVAAAYEQDLRHLRIGQEARVHLDAFPDEAFAGAVTTLEFQVDPGSRTIGVRIDLANSDVASWDEPYPIRPGMFGSVEVVTGRTTADVVLPEAALVHEGPEDFVFVQVEPGEFERRRVEVRPGGGDTVAIASGLAPGEPVVVAGTFTLKSVARSGELGGGHSH
jgi:cobalt-zinc-cadmium efflux system membrane fusion protein